MEGLDAAFMWTPAHLVSPGNERAVSHDHNQGAEPSVENAKQHWQKKWEEKTEMGRKSQGEASLFCTEEGQVTEEEEGEEQKTASYDNKVKNRSQ